MKYFMITQVNGKWQQTKPIQTLWEQQRFNLEMMIANPTWTPTPSISERLNGAT